MTFAIKHCRREKKRGERKIDGLRKKKRFLNLGFQNAQNTMSNQKQETYLSMKKFVKNIVVKIYKTDPYFYEHYEKKSKVDKNGHNYIPFKIDVYFSEYDLDVETDGKSHIDRYLVTENQRQETLEKNLIVNLLELIQVKKVIKL